MKSILISIQPKFCEKIANGEKTIEVRKTKPKIETPFKCYIYCTKAKKESEKTCFDKYTCVIGNGKVIGEFVCDRITYYYPFGLRGHKLSEETKTAMCLSIEDLNKYGKLNRVYGWHISELEIYDEPKELREFGKSKSPQRWCYVEE